MANKAPSLSQKLANVQHMPVLITATSASKDPPDGFIVKDIIKMSFESTPTRVFLQQYLVNELCSTNNVFIKIRVLRLLISLLEEGHVEFKQNLRKMPEPFNEASKLRPHQPKSESLVAECGRIRDMASRILDMLFEDTPELRRRPVQSTYTSSDSSGQGSNSSNRITGFGNSSYTPPAQQETTTNKIKKFLGVQISNKKPIQYDPDYVTTDPVPHMKGSSSPFTPHSSSTLGGKHQEGDALTGRDHVTGRAGGGWDDPSDSPLQPRSRPEPVYTQPEPTYTQSDEPEYSGQYLEATSTEQEKRLVDEITAPGGVKAAPPREMLSSFVSRCRVLDCQSVVEYLRLKLESQENQVVLRALFVIETLSRSDLPDILSHLDLVLEELSTLTQSQHTTIRTKANKILMQLSAQNAQASQQRTVKVEPSNHSKSDDIIGLGGGAKEEVDNDEPVMTQEQADLAASLFSGMSVSGEKAARSKPVKQVKKPVKQVKQVKAQAPTSTYEDLLGLNNESSQQQPPPSQVPPPSQAPPTQEEMVPEGGDDSLLMFGSDDEDFDPLKKAGRSGSLRSSLTSSITSQTGLVTQQATSVHISKNGVGSGNVLQPTQSSSGGLLGDLSGIDLSKTSPMSTPPLAHREQQPSFAGLQAIQPTSVGVLSASMPAQTQPTSQSLINSGAYPQQQGPLLNQGGILYAPVGPAYGGGVAQGGGVQQTPMMFMAGQRMPYGAQPGMMVGGEARPVQRATSTSMSADTPTSDSGFSFLGKSNKGTAFDFVQDEMRASKK